MFMLMPRLNVRWFTYSQAVASPCTVQASSVIVAATVTTVLPLHQITTEILV